MTPRALVGSNGRLEEAERGRRLLAGSRCELIRAVGKQKKWDGTNKKA